MTTSGIDRLPRWTLRGDPTVSIGSVEGGGPDGFTVVTGALVLPDSTILVSDNQPASVRQFDHRGRFIRQLVREGQGPGELRWAGAPMRIAGDSIAILSVPEGRLVVFDSTLDHVFTNPLVGFRSGDSLFGAPEVMLSSTDAIGRLYRMGRPAEAGVGRVPLVLGRIRVDGSSFGKIAEGRGLELYFTESGMGLGVPLAASSVSAVGRGVVYLGDTDVPAIGIWRFDGTKVRSIRWEAAPDPATEADRAQAFARESTSLMMSPEIRRTRPSSQQRLFDQLRGVPLPAHAPYFTRLVAAGDGGLWIERRPRPWLDSADYLVADSSGALVARIEVPSRLTILQVGADWVLGTWRTEDDVRLVRRFRFDRPEPDQQP